MRVGVSAPGRHRRVDLAGSGLRASTSCIWSSRSRRRTESVPEPQDDKVLKARFLDEIQLQSADVRPPIAEFLSACVREMPSSPQYPRTSLVGFASRFPRDDRA